MSRTTRSCNKKGLGCRSQLVVLNLIFLILFAFPVLAQPPEPHQPRRGILARCVDLLSAVGGRSTSELPAAASVGNPVAPQPIDGSFEIRTLDDLLTAFSRGFVPDISNKSQRAAFDIYLKMRFGQNTHYVTADTVSQVSKFLEKHPDLEKEPRHSVRVEALERSYPVTPKLEALIKKQREASGQVVSNLYQIDANLGFWKKLLLYEEPEISKDLPKDERKRLQEEAKNKFIAILDTKIPAALRKELAEGKLPPAERAKKLYQVLKTIREEFIANGKDAKDISQAMIDVIHSVGFQDKATAKALKEGDGLERLTAFRRALTERENLAHELGFEGHFVEALSSLGVRMPTGVKSMKDFEDDLTAIESEVLNSAVIKTGGGRTGWVRATSLIESPLRSCLGLDCSSNSWLTAPLEPNRVTYTWTDPEGHSNGQISLTLGDAQVNKQSVKVAFINKIQNVPAADLSTMIEGVRQSLAADGYLLGLPVDLGENIAAHGGISNTEGLFPFIRRIPTDTEIISNFKPHKHSQNYGYDKHSYDRSNLGLPMRAVSPLTGAEGLSFTLEPKISSWNTKEPIDLDKLVQASYALKNGSTEEKARYIPSMEAIKKAGLKSDPEFDSVLSGWLKDPKEDFKLRKQVLFYYLSSEGTDGFASRLSAFSPSDRATIVQNALDTPRYRTKLLEKRALLPEVITLVRGSKKVRDMLLAEFDSKGVAAHQKVLESSDVDDQLAPVLLRRVRAGLRSTDIDKVVSLLEALQGTSISNWFVTEIQSHFVENLAAPTLLNRALSSAMKSSSKAARDFANRLIFSDDPRLEEFPIIKIYREILSRIPDKDMDQFQKASLDWMSDERVDLELKTEFLLAQTSPWAKEFRDLDERVSKSQRAIVEEQLQRRSTIRVYGKLAEERKLEPSQLESAKMEQFLRVDMQIPKEGIKVRLGSPDGQTADENGVVHPLETGRYGDDEKLRYVTLTKNFHPDATIFTQLQWFLLNGDAPSRFHGDGEDFTMRVRGKSGDSLEIDPNRPVEQVDFDQTKKTIDLLAKATKKAGGRGVPRLLTDAEWEVMIRAGSDTPYFFGTGGEEELKERAWYHGNANGKTHKVASMLPNRRGIFDPVGNVWVWIEDGWAGTPPSGVNPLVEWKPGSFRVVRGGSWDNFAQYLRSASRNRDRPSYRGDALGFRLVWDMPE